MGYTVRLFVTAKLGAPMEDMGEITVAPKPTHSGLVYFEYHGRQTVAMVALVDPPNWEKRPGIVPRIHVYLSESEEPREKKPPKQR